MSLVLLRRAAVSLLAVGGVIACTAIVSEDATQCSNDADCAARGPDFADTVCGPKGFCEAKPAAPPECTKNSDCKDKGADMVCSALQQKCTSLAMEGCKVEYGNPTDDGTVILGLLSEIDVNDTLYFRQRQHLAAAKLAFREYFEKSGATLPGNRKAALVACTEHFPRKVSAHLANIGALAVIGPSDEARQRAVVETLAQAKVPSFTPWMNGNPSAVVPESQSVAWIASFLRPEVVPPLNALVAEQETRIRTQRSPAPSAIRIATVINQPTTSTFNSFAEYGELMDQRLLFNGKSAVENQNDPACGNCYKRFETSQSAKAVVEQRAKDIIAFKPDIIVPFADIDWGAQLLPKLEELYELEPETTYRPVYVHAFLQIEDQGYKFLSVSNDDVRKRITGIRPVRDNSFEVFSNKFKDAYRSPSTPDKLGGDPNPGAGRAFETALLLLFATHAALVEDPAAGPQSVVAALKKVTDKTSTTKVTLNDIPSGVARLNAKESIDLIGLFTSFAFDDKTQSARASWATWCVTDSATYTGGARVFQNGSFGSTDYCP
jgi:hypothetical protein